MRLTGHPKFSAGRPLEISIDGQALSARAKDSVSLVRRGGAWAAAKYEAPPNAKRLGAEGPISEVLAGRHIYVYGTGGSPSREELLARRTEAARAATGLRQALLLASLCSPVWWLTAP